MKQRIITGLILFLVLAPLIVFESLRYIFIAAMGILSIVATKELLDLFDKEKKISLNIRIFIMALTFIIFYAIGYLAVKFDFAQYNFNVLLAAIIFSAMSILSLSIFTKFSGKEVTNSIFSILYAAIGLGSLVLIKDVSRNLIIYLFLVTTMTDVFAYFGGMKFGKNKMCPTISPKKTWEGAIIGTIMGTAVATIFALFLGFGDGNIFASFFPSMNNSLLVILTIIITLAASVIAQIGDLVASKLKRSNNVKDFGNIFPGHGGVLDRFDSAIFVGLFLLVLSLLLL